eukprot:UN03683
MITSGLDVQRGQVQIKDLTENTRGGQPQRFRKGACTNCGAMGHQKAACLERPRALTAKAANTTFAQRDEIVEHNKNLGFEKNVIDIPISNNKIF